MAAWGEWQRSLCILLTLGALMKGLRKSVYFRRESVLVMKKEALRDPNSLIQSLRNLVGGGRGGFTGPWGPASLPQEVGTPLTQL